MMDEKEVNEMDDLEADLLMMIEHVALALAHLMQVYEGPSEVKNPHVVEAAQLLNDVVINQCSSADQFSKIMGLAIAEIKKTSKNSQSVLH
jgi:hypothetical protein